MLRYCYCCSGFRCRDIFRRIPSFRNMWCCEIQL